MATVGLQELVAELSMQLMLLDSDDVAAEELHQLCRVLAELGGQLSSEQGELFGVAIETILEQLDSSDGEVVVAAIDCVGKGIEKLQELQFRAESVSSAEAREKKATRQGNQSKNVELGVSEDWGFDDVPESHPPETQAEADKSIDSFVLGGVADTAIDVGTSGRSEEVEPIERSAEMLENLADFYVESSEAIEQADQVLLNSEHDCLNSMDIDTLFRGYHTIKGIAGFVGLKQASTLAHHTESLLGELRANPKRASGETIDCLLEVNQVMRALVHDVGQAIEISSTVPYHPQVDGLVTCIESHIVANKLAPNNDAASTQKSLQVAEELKTEEEQTNPAPVRGAGTPAKQPVNEVAARAKPDVRKPALAIPPMGKGVRSIRETLKVDVARVDSLLEMVGEMVITESMITNDEELSQIRSQKLANNLRQMAKITRDLQKVVLQLRMVPVRGLFTKTARIVRELSKQCNKSLRLEISGESSELDRSMVERLSEPLLHMIRNAVDHGIEDREVRALSGKPAEGCLGLSAYHESGNLVIEIRDDGGGLDTQKILARARERGLVQAHENLSEADIFALIFAPGFSTAESVTDLSGRGVGMDVVLKNIKSMRGRIAISSVLGQGTKFKIVLPLTLAIIDGTLITCAKQTFILPTLSIVESLRPEVGMVRVPMGQEEILQVRGTTYPLYRLNEVLGYPEHWRESQDSHAIIIESASQTFALLVEDIVAQQQVVIKSLDQQIRSPIFAGAAILSDGRIGLIIDVDEVVDIASQPDRFGEVA